MTAPWFRVPAFLPLQPPEVRSAWVWLLGSWHAGANPGTREIQRATGFGAGRSIQLKIDVLAWAKGAEAAHPDEPTQATTQASTGTPLRVSPERLPEHLPEHRNDRPTPEHDEPRNTRRNTSRNTTPSVTGTPHARAVPCGDQRDQKEKEGVMRARAHEPRKLTVPTTWEAVSAHPDQIVALPWSDSHHRIARAVSMLTVDDLRKTAPDKLQMIPSGGDWRARQIIEALAGWGLVVGDLAPRAAPVLVIPEPTADDEALATQARLEHMQRTADRVNARRQR